MVVFPLSDDLNEEEEEILLQELENITEQDLQDFIAESKEDVHDLAAAVRAAEEAGVKRTTTTTATHDNDEVKDNSIELLLQNVILKKREIQLEMELSLFYQELVKEALKHNLNDKEIVSRTRRYTISRLNENQKRQAVDYIFARHDLIEDPKYTPEESDIEFLKESERDIIKGRKGIRKMEEDLRKLDD
jgi:hypothetical protein